MSPWRAEISLRGLVLPGGRIKEKVLAAKETVFPASLPELNRRDMEEIPTSSREGIRFEKTADQALLLALELEAPSGFSPGERLAARSIS
jgi:ATP-dependent Lon protease